jgi:hypothetical protein
MRQCGELLEHNILWEQTTGVEKQPPVELQPYCLPAKVAEQTRVSYAATTSHQQLAWPSIHRSGGLGMQLIGVFLQPESAWHVSRVQSLPSSQSTSVTVLL